jgi:hypothetical protein
MLANYNNYLTPEDPLLLEIKLPSINSINLNDVYKKSKHNLKIAKKVLKDYNLKINFKSLAEKIKKDYNSSGDPKIVARRLVSTINNEVGQQIKEKSLPEKIGMSLLLVALLIAINTFVAIFFTGIGGPQFGLFIGAVFCAPLIEEYAKRIAVLEKYPWLYTGIFAGIEFLLYAASGAAIIPRLLVVLMHFMTTLLQKTFHTVGLELNNEYIGKLGFFLAVMLHALNNLIAVANMM